MKQSLPRNVSNMKIILERPLFYCSMLIFWRAIRHINHSSDLKDLTFVMPSKRNIHGTFCHFSFRKFRIDHLDPRGIQSWGTGRSSPGRAEAEPPECAWMRTAAWWR